MTKNPYAKIKNNAILTASPQELTLMLYEGAIKFGNQAIQAIESDDISLAHEKIVRVQDIIEEFMITLDHNYAVAESMNVMYDYMYRQLMEADAKKDVEIVKEVVGYLREYRDVWKEAMQLAKGVESRPALEEKAQ